jgi:hypothetical protein
MIELIIELEGNVGILDITGSPNIYFIHINKKVIK